MFKKIQKSKQLKIKKNYSVLSLDNADSLKNIKLQKQ